MPLRSSSEAWGWGARLLHWTMAALILFQLGLGLWMTEFTADLLRRFALTQTHKSWGTVVFGLAVLRLVWRLGEPARPAHPPGMPRWQARVAAVSHAGLYLLMLVLPLSGWVLASAAPVQDLLGLRNMVFGLFALPDPWVPGVEAVSLRAGQVHQAAALLLGALIALHAGAALWHHFVARDAVLRRMTKG